MRHLTEPAETSRQTRGHDRMSSRDDRFRLAPAPGDRETSFCCRSYFGSDATNDSFDQVIGGFEQGVIEGGVLAGDDFAGVALDLADKDRLAGLEIGDRGH